MSDIDTSSTCSDSEYLNLYPTEFSTVINPSGMTFSEMTTILDNIRNTIFLPLVNEARHISTLHPVEVATLSDISGIIRRYNRAPALDRRGEWPFIAIAGPDEVLVAEILLALFSGQRTFCEYGESNGRANE